MDSKPYRRRLLALPPVRSGVAALARALPRRDGDLVIAMFHRTLCSARFGEQLDALQAQGEVVTGARVVAALSGGPALPPRAVWLTFDDAYRDFEGLAWPVLRARGLTATMFVATAYAAGEREFWWERLAAAFLTTSRAGIAVGDLANWPGPTRLDSTSRRQAALREARERVKALPHAAGMALAEALVTLLGGTHPGDVARAMPWSTLRALAAEGLELANHTRNHPMLDRVGLDEARAEVRAGFDDLAREAPGALPILAYPSGQLDADVARAVGEAGARCAVTTRLGIARLDRDDRLQLPRVAVGPHADATAVRLRITLARPALQRWFGGIGGNKTLG